MFGDLGKLFKIAGQVKTKMPEMKEKLAASSFSAETAEGAICATVNGRLELADLQIKPDLLTDGQTTAEMLEEYIKAAVASAQHAAAEAAREAMKELTGGMDLPGMI